MCRREVHSGDRNCELWTVNCERDVCTTGWYAAITLTASILMSTEKNHSVVLAKHSTAPWWWFLREPKHVGGSVIILNCFNISMICIIVCISWKNKKCFWYYWCTVQTWRFTSCVWLILLIFMNTLFLWRTSTSPSCYDSHWIWPIKLERLMFFSILIFRPYDIFEIRYSSRVDPENTIFLVFLLIQLMHN